MNKPQQLVRVFNVMTDGRWHTLAGVGKKLGIPTQSVSARLRDLRKPKFGRYLVDRQPKGTVFVYRLG